MEKELKLGRYGIGKHMTKYQLVDFKNGKFGVSQCYIWKASDHINVQRYCQLNRKEADELLDFIILTTSIDKNELKVLWGVDIK